MTPGSQDLIVSIYCHLPDNIRRTVHQRAELALKPGGLFILEAFHQSQSKYQSRGPKTTDVLYDLEALTGDFQSLQIWRHWMVYVISMRVLDTQDSAISYDWSYKNRHSEVSHAAFFIAAILASQAFAEDYVPDAENGAFLHDDHCVDRHMVDNHEALYSRENRIVNERIRLNGQVSACVQVLDLGWFPDEEKDVIFESGIFEFLVLRESHCPHLITSYRDQSL